MIEFRHWTPEDTTTLLGWVDEWPEMLEYIGHESVADLIEKVTSAMLATNAVLLMGEDEGDPIGYVAAFNAQPDGSAMVQIGMPKHHRGRGNDLMQAALETAFGSLGLQTLIAAVPRTKRGKIVERFDRKFGFKGHDVKILTLTKGDWEKRNGRRDSD